MHVHVYICTYMFMNSWTCTYMSVPCSDTYVPFCNILSRVVGIQMDDLTPPTPPMWTSWVRTHRVFARVNDIPYSRRPLPNTEPSLPRVRRSAQHGIKLSDHWLSEEQHWQTWTRAWYLNILNRTRLPPVSHCHGHGDTKLALGSFSLSTPAGKLES
jgi:hypothetical protein